MANNLFSGWAIVELMGHVRIAGRVSEEEHFGTKLGRIDIPGPEAVCEGCGGSGDGVRSSGPDPEDSPCASCLGLGKVPSYITQFFAGGSIYRLTPCTEEVARAVAQQTTPDPVYAWDVRRQLGLDKPAVVVHDDDSDEHDDPDLPY